MEPGPGELLGSYIGPAAKATAVYLRYELNVPCRKISRFFEDFFGLTFVPASAYGFERQATRRGRPLYEDPREKIRAYFRHQDRDVNINTGKEILERELKRLGVEQQFTYEQVMQRPHVVVSRLRRALGNAAA